MAEAKVNLNKDPNAACTYCGASVTAHFCAECGRIQAVGTDSDYFSFLGLPRKLRIDEAELEKSFYSLSRRFHPDYFMSASDGERQASTELSSMLNDAYRTLRDRVSRCQYLLSLEGYKEAEKKAPPDLLEEVFELNMQIDELKVAKKSGDQDEVGARASLEGALIGLHDSLDKIDGKLIELFEEWDSAFDKDSPPGEKKVVLDRMSELLSHRSYIRNIVRDIKEELD